jgi:hypothetical protein
MTVIRETMEILRSTGVSPVTSFGVWTRRNSPSDWRNESESAILSKTFFHCVFVTGREWQLPE